MNQTNGNFANPDLQTAKERRRWWQGSLGLALLLPLAYCKSVEMLNERGICIREMRRLPDEELIRPWVVAAIKNYPPLDEKGKKNDKGEWASSLQDYGSPIPYRDVAEFFAVNPICCTVQSSSPYSGYTPNDEERKGGFGRGFVKLEYKLRYRATDGSDRFFRMYAKSIAVTNCGETSGHQF